MRNPIVLPVISFFVLLTAGSALAPAQVAHATGSLNGVAGSMPAFYDGNLFTINFMKVAVGSTLLAHNMSVNTIYMSEPGLPGGKPFISVLDAIQGDGFNPLWQEVQIAFTTGNTPRQLTSDTEVLAAKASGEITLTQTNEVFRCSVIGKPAAQTAGGLTGSSGAAGPSGVHGTTWGRLKEAYR